MHDVLALRRANPIAAVIADAGVELRRAGTRLIGRCPLHGDGEPSLVIYPQTQSYFCFGCQAGGDVIDFVSRQRQVGFKEAAALLNGIEVTTSGRPCPPQAETPVRLVTPNEAGVIDAAVGLFQKALWRSRPALTYLAARGIDEKTAQLCRLGFGHAALADELRYRGLNLGTARSIGLLRGDRNTMIGRIIIPDFSGDTASWLTARSLGGKGRPRYFNLRTPSPVLGLSRVTGPEVILTEGPFDWLTAVQWGLPAAALAGSNVSKAALRALARFRRVFVVMDNDAAGRRATGELSSALGSKALPVELPTGVKDLNDLGRLPEGRQLFERCLAEARPGKETTRWDTNASAALASAG